MVCVLTDSGKLKDDLKDFLGLMNVFVKAFIFSKQSKLS